MIIGYLCEKETGFYYVSSRYYDPEVGRFINADTTDILGVQSNLYDKNLYAYCDNNPVVRRDINGYVWETIFDIMSLASKICDRIGIIINGKIIVNDTLNNIYQLYNSNDLEDIFFDLYKKEVGDELC